MKLKIHLRVSDRPPAETLFGKTQERRFRPNFLAALSSAALHGIVILFLAVLRAPLAPAPISYSVTMLPLKDRVIWYTPQERLPDVASAEHKNPAPAAVQVPRPGQAITADAPQARDRKQFIWQPPPKISLQNEIRSPNVLAFNPKPQAPAPKTFVPPQNSKPSAEPPRVVLPEASPLAVPATAVPLPVVGGIPAPPKPPIRQFTPPVAAGPAVAGAVALDASPALPSSDRLPTLAVIGLDPSRTAEIPIPEGSRPSRFSSGPANSNSGEGQNAALIVPGLNVTGGPAAAEGVVVTPRKPAAPYHEPTAPEWAKAVSGKDSRRLARSMMSVPLRPGARVVSPAVETLFPNRPVYTTSFEIGEDGASAWVIWFSEHGNVPSQYASVKPPVPWTRDGGWTVASVLPSHIQVAALIDRDGRPVSVSVLKCSNDALRADAAKLIEQLEFLPALRNGEPVAVDTLIEVSAGRP